jgi:Ca2+-binding RTX toxin-like protein
VTSGTESEAHTRGRSRRLLLLCAAVLITVLFVAVHASAAVAASVNLRGSILTFSAQSGEDNNVEIKVVPDSSFPGTDKAFQITDGWPILDFDGPGSGGCVSLLTFAECPATDGMLLFVNTLDGDDIVTIDDSVARPVFVCSGAGNDTVSGGPGGDRIAGGSGSDLIDGRDGSDIIGGTEVGTSLNCPPEGGVADSPGGDHLIGGPDADQLQGTSGPDTIDGDDGDDNLFGAGGDDTLDGGAENDNLVGGDGNDSLHGRDGVDELTGGPGSDSEFGGSGNDQLGTSWFLFEPPFVAGNAPVLERDTGDDAMDGGPGDDVLNGGPGQLQVTAFFTSLRDVEEGVEVAEPNGSDTLWGGDGNDTVTYVKRSSPVALSLDGQANDGADGERDRMGTDVERVVGGSGDDTIVGSASNDILDGGKGSDKVTGGAGDDDLSGGRGDEGADRLEGGEGNDTLSGVNGKDWLLGGVGDDHLAGGGGPDRLDGDDGDDVMAGGPGGDLLVGGAGNDHLEGADPLLFGADAGDDLRGGQGTDSLAGGDGDDLLDGGSGRDQLRGGDGEDTAVYAFAARPVKVTLDRRADDGEEGERDDVGPDVEGAHGGGAADDLTGNADENNLTGSPGEDYIEGGAGVDRLAGNDGNDAIVSRDSASDQVSCGRGFDIVFADPLDIVRDNCELVDRSESPAASVGRLVSLQRVRGSARVRPRSMDRFIPLAAHADLPVRSVVDASKGAVRLLTRGNGGPVRHSLARGAAFLIDQAARRSATAKLRLRGGAPSACGRAKSRVRRSLWVRARGPVRVGGRRSYASARHATFRITDRCDGTLVRVRRGRATVVDKAGKRVRLGAGETYLARP